MMNLFDKVKAVCALVVMGLGLAAYSAAPTVTSVTAQQRYPWNGLVAMGSDPMEMNRE